MADNTVTLVLDGDVPLAEFARAIEGFNDLVRALCVEVGADSLDWTIQDLQVSSALASASGIGEQQAVVKVIAAYADVGTALENNTPINHSETVRQAASKIIAIRDRRIPSVRFETATRDAIVKIIPGRIIKFPEHKSSTEMVAKATSPAYGAIRGRIQTLTNRGGLRFTLFDVLHDKAVSCYFADGKQDLIKNLWGRMVTVEGIITRDPTSGRPLSVRQVNNVIELPEPTRTFDYMDARGAAPSLNKLSPEDAIRRIRDA
jgi:hypothetical protein